MTPSRFTKVKIAIGYSLLLAILLFSLLFINREMDTLAAFDNQQTLMTDSLLILLREKDRNTIQMLRVLNEGNDNQLSVNEIEEIIAEQDSFVAQQRVEHRIITKRDSLLTKPKKKGFFKRLAEAFSPSKQDTAVLLNTSFEVSTDTILSAYNPTDSLHHKIRAVSQQKREQKRMTVRKKDVQFRRLDTQLTAQIDTLVKAYEQNVSERARQDTERSQEVRRHSTRIIAGIAVGAVLLSAVFLIIIWRDITRSNRYRKQLEEANRRAEALLDAREKMMLAITHDFKAPLGSIIGYTDLLGRLTKEERQHFYLDNMKSSSQHLLKLVSDLLDFHRLDLNKAEVNRVTFNPSQLFEEIRVSFEPLTAAKGLALGAVVAPELDSRFISDPLRIRQIVNNLISNAVKFTASGSISLKAGYASSKLRIDVQDTGKGIASDDKQRIFEEFTRLPGAQGEEGFGLGLSIVHKLVSLLEGEIRVESTLGKGSTFTVILPLYPVGESVGRKVTDRLSGASATTDSHSAEEKSGELSTPSPMNILLIDDDKIQLALTSAMLEQQGIRATCCEQPDELFEQLRLHAFDALLTDVQMPAINGFELVKLLRASNLHQAKEIAVIAVTARSDMKEAMFLEHGFSGCLYKPFTVAELMTKLTGRCSSEEESKKQYKLPGNRTPDFKLLTAFSADDEEASRAILVTFIEETEKNISRMEVSLLSNQPEGVAAMAHKLLPLLTLIGADAVLPTLARLEECREGEIDAEVRRRVEEVLPLLRNVVGEARKYLAGS